MKNSIFTFAALFGVVISTWAAPLSGRVVGPDGKPVTGATVAVVERGAVVDFYEKKAKPFLLVTNEEGIFSFEPTRAEPLDLWQYSSQIGSGLAIVRVLAPGLAQSEALFQADGQTFALREGVKWHGVVRDEAGIPIAGANLHLAGFQNLREEEKKEPLLDAHDTTKFPVEATVSDENGRFELLVDAPDDQARQGYLSINDSRFAREILCEPLDKEIIVTVHPGANLTGRILDRSGMPVPGIKVFASSLDWNADMTDENGTYTLSGLPVSQTSEAAPLSLIATQKQKDGFYHDVQDIIKFEEWKAGNVVAPNWVWQWVHMKGQIVDAHTKKPISGAYINYIIDNANHPENVDEQGFFDVAVKSSGCTLLIGQREFHYLASPLSWTDCGDRAEFDVGLIELTPSPLIKAIVRDEDGQVPPNIWITVNWWKKTTPPFYRFELFHIPADGSFLIGAVPPGTYQMQVSGGWEILDSDQLTVPEIGQVAERPLEIWVRRPDDKAKQP